MLRHTKQKVPLRLLHGHGVCLQFTVFSITFALHLGQSLYFGVIIAKSWDDEGAFLNMNFLYRAPLVINPSLNEQNSLLHLDSSPFHGYRQAKQKSGLLEHFGHRTRLVWIPKLLIELPQCGHGFELAFTIFSLSLESISFISVMV